MQDQSRIRSSSEASLIPSSLDRKPNLEEKNAYLLIQNSKLNSKLTITSLDDESLNYINHHYGNNSLWLFSNHNPFRLRLQKLLAHTYFNYAIYLIIILNAIFLIFETIDSLRKIGEYANFVFIVLYTIECIMKIIAHGFILSPYTYLRDAWNWVDLFVIITGLISFDPNISLNFLALRIFRLIIPLRALSFYPSMRIFVSTLIESMLDLSIIYFMMIFFFFLFAILGLTLWTERFHYRCRTGLTPFNQTFPLNPTYSSVICGGEVDCGDLAYCINSLEYYPELIGDDVLDEERQIATLNWGLTKFGNIFQSLFVVFLTTTGEGWPEIMIMLMNGYSYVVSFIYFILSVVLNYYFIINLSVAAMVYNFENAQQDNALFLNQKKKKDELKKPSLRNTIKSRNNNEEVYRSAYRLKYTPIDIMSKSKTKRFDCLVSCDKLRCFENFSPRTEYHSKFKFGFYCYFVYQQPIVQYFFYICIIVNFILLALDRVDMGDEEAYIVDILDITLVSIFVFEIILLMFGIGIYRFIRSAWYIIDTIIILTSLIEIIVRKANDEKSMNSIITVLLLLRVIRLYKLLRNWHNFKIMTQSIGHTIVKMVDFLVLFLFFIFMYTLLGYSFFQDAIPESLFNFDSFISSLISVIRVIIGDHWQDIFFECYRSPGSSTILSYVFFISLIFFGQITLLNIFIAYLISNFQRSKREFEKNVIVHNHIMKTINFCFKEHQMQLKFSQKTIRKSDKKKKIITLNQYLQKLQNKEVISEGLLVLMHKNTIDFTSFEVKNALGSEMRMTSQSETIKVMFFEKRKRKGLIDLGGIEMGNGIEDCYDNEVPEDFYYFNLAYYQKPEFQSLKSPILKIIELFSKKHKIKKKGIKRSNSCPNLKKITVSKTKQNHPIFRFESSSSLNTIHQSENEEDDEEIKGIESSRPIKQTKPQENKLNKSDSLIENDDVSYSNNKSIQSESFNNDIKSMAQESSVHSEPKNKHKLTVISKKAQPITRFKTTIIQSLIFKRKKFNRAKATIESIEEEEDSRTSSLPNKDTERNLSSKQDMALSDRKRTMKERLITIYDHMKESSLFIFHKTWRIRILIRKLVYHPVFNYTIFALILCNCIIMCFDNPWVDPESVWAKVIYGFNLCFNILFIIECVLKVISDDFLFREKEDITSFKSIKYIIDHHETTSNSSTNNPTSMNSSSNSANVSWNKLSTVTKEKFISKANHIISKRKAYLLEPANVIDFICIILSIVDMSITEKLSYLRVLRIFRAIKPIRILTKSDKLKMLVDCLIKSLPALAHTIFICFIFIFVYALFGVSLFKKDLQYYCTDILIIAKEDCLALGLRWYKNPNNFDNFFIALKTNFIIMLADNWGDMMAKAGQIYNNRWVYWYFVIHVFVGYLIILNLFVSVLIQNFKYLKQKEKKNKALSLPEREWIHIQKMMVKVRPKYKKELNEDNQCEVILNSIVNSNWFNYASLSLTGLGLFILIWQHENSSKKFLLAIDVLSYVLTVLFNVEIILKIMYFKKGFFYSVWDDFDLFIVILCDLMVILNILTHENIVDLHALCILPFILRSFRLLRVLRKVSYFGKLHSIIDTLVYLIPSIGSIGIILLLLILIYANIGMNVFGTLPFRKIINDNINFRNIASSALLLFQIATKDKVGEFLSEISYHDCRDPSSATYQQDSFCFNYNVICYDDYLVNYTSMNDLNMFSCGSNFSYFYLISFVLLGPLFIMNLCIVIVVEGFNESMKDNEGLFTRDYIEKFISTWIKYDTDYKRIVKPHEFLLIMKEVQPSLGINYDRTHDNMILSSQPIRDKYLSYKELISLINQQRSQLKEARTAASEMTKSNVIRRENKCYIINGSYLSHDLKTFTNDREVMIICDKLNLSFIDPKAEVKQKDIKEPITKIAPIDVIDKEVYIHFIDACLALSRFSICKMMNVLSTELRPNVVGSYTKKIWNKKYKSNKDIINSFYEPRKQREKISHILATKLIYSKLIKPYKDRAQDLIDKEVQCLIIQETMRKNADNTINNDEDQSFDNLEDNKEIDQMIKCGVRRSNKRHTGSIGNMSYFYNMKQMSQNTEALNKEKNRLSFKLSSFQPNADTKDKK